MEQHHGALKSNASWASRACGTNPARAMAERYFALMWYSLEGAVIGFLRQKVSIRAGKSVEFYHGRWDTSIGTVHTACLLSGSNTCSPERAPRETSREVGRSFVLKRANPYTRSTICRISWRRRKHVRSPCFSLYNGRRSTVMHLKCPCSPCVAHVKGMYNAHITHTCNVVTYASK